MKEISISIDHNGHVSPVSYESFLDMIMGVRTPRQEQPKPHHLAAHDAIARAIGDEKVEHYAVVFFDDKDQIIATEVLGSDGNEHKVAINVRKIFERAIELKAAAFVFGHNHPVGPLLASAPDFETTTVLQTVGGYLKLPIVDHVIVGPGGNRYSMRFG